MDTHPLGMWPEEDGRGKNEFTVETRWLGSRFLLLFPPPPPKTFLCNVTFGGKDCTYTFILYCELILPFFKR